MSEQADGPPLPADRAVLERAFSKAWWDDDYAVAFPAIQHLMKVAMHEHDQYQRLDSYHLTLGQMHDYFPKWALIKPRSRKAVKVPVYEMKCLQLQARIREWQRQQVGAAGGLPSLPAESEAQKHPVGDAAHYEECPACVQQLSDEALLALMPEEER